MTTWPEALVATGKDLFKSSMTNWDGVPGKDMVVESLPAKATIKPTVETKIRNQLINTNQARRAES
jgi:hypothetical protein